MKEALSDFNYNNAPVAVELEDFPDTLLADFAQELVIPNLLVNLHGLCQ